VSSGSPFLVLEHYMYTECVQIDTANTDSEANGSALTLKRPKCNTCRLYSFKVLSIQPKLYFAESCGVQRTSSAKKTKNNSDH